MSDWDIILVLFEGNSLSSYYEYFLQFPTTALSKENFKILSALTSIVVKPTISLITEALAFERKKWSWH